MATAASGPTLIDVVEGALSRGGAARGRRDPRSPFGAAFDPESTASKYDYVAGGGDARASGASQMSVLDAAAEGLDDAAFLRALDALASGAFADALTMGGDVPVRRAGDRLLYVPGSFDRPPALLLMTSDAASETGRLATPDDLPGDRLTSASLTEALLRVGMDAGAQTYAGRLVRGTAASARTSEELLFEVLLRSEPEIVITRLPRMERLCAPWPHLPIDCRGQRSTAGLFARDADGVLGVTCCFHGTGPVGTVVTIGLRDFVVTRASEVQDTVFVAMPGFNLPDLAGLSGVRAAAPGQGDRARFDGATNGQRDTVVQSHDAGLLRRRPGVQLKVQTRPDTDRGDSGSALIDGDDRVVGFAFEKTAFDDWPQFTDWIWAANALDALGLTPVAPAPAQGG